MVASSSIRTFTGKLVDPFNMACSDIDIRDIAHALSNMCRFNGHVKDFYSVGQHSTLMGLYWQGSGDRATWEVRRCLLHDASEAYIADLVRPVKHHPMMQVYRDLEKSITKVIYTWAGLTYPDPNWLHVLDDRMLRTEQRDFMFNPSAESVFLDAKAEQVHVKPGTPIPYRLSSWSPRMTEHRFLKLWEECK